MLEGYKTLIGAIVALAAEGARLAGVDIGDQEGLVNSILVIFGGILAIYGRMKASGPIGG
ncbi:MAG TPA: hypothetical protein PLU99_14260 [Phycisphaerae bacterium]|jgi:hypothetical protein|nr:hypothetical protein [Phycisphaerae bacterium]